MNLQPTIFISSIISEFSDLRGALRYFLGKSGFRVLMSEEPDFGADCEEDSLENCRTRIDSSDYYLLIIGLNTGYKFNLEDGHETTVTFEEFRHFLKLKEEGKAIRIIAFIRAKAWNLYTKKDEENMHPLQHEFIDDLVNNTLLNQEIGRWRHSFDKFSDIITVLETNQNGLFLEATRKKGIYRTYLKSELTQILKSLLIKDKSNGAQIKTLKQFINFPELNFSNYLRKEKIRKDVAVHIIAFIASFSYKEELLLKINRTFNYVSQGEFSFFNVKSEKYEMPNYIKTIIQVLEILEKVFLNFQRGDIYKNLAQQNVDNFLMSEFEYSFVKNQLHDLSTATIKLINLMRLFNGNWNDFEKMDDEFYEYRGTANSISIQELIDFSENYF